MSLESVIMPEFVKLRPAEEFSTPAALSSELFDFQGGFGIDYLLPVIVGYLRMPYVFDSFESHDERRPFMEELSDEQRAIYSNNALRLGSINSVSLALQLLASAYKCKEDSDFFGKIREIKENRLLCFGSDYDTQRPDIKLQRVFNFKQKLAGILNYLDVRSVEGI